MAVMEKAKQLFIRVVTHKSVLIAVAIIGVAWGAFGFVENLKAAKAYVLGTSDIDIYYIVTLITVFLIAIFRELNKRRKNQKQGKYFNGIWEYNMKVYSIAYEIVVSFKNSVTFSNIVEKHKERVNNYFKLLIGSLKEKVDSNITEDTLRQFDKVKNNIEGQKRLMSKIFNELAGLPQLEEFLSKEHKSCLNDIQNRILNQIRTNGIFSQFRHFAQQQFGTSGIPEFDIDPADIELEVDKILKQLPNLSFGHIFSHKDKDNDLTIASLLAGGMTANDIEHILNDVVGGEAAEHVLHELVDYAGTFIPVVGQMFIVVKVFKFLYSLRDRSEDLKQLKEEIYDALFKDYQKINKWTCIRIQSDSLIYLENLLVKFNSGYRESKKFYKQTTWYM